MPLPFLIGAAVVAATAALIKAASDDSPSSSPSSSSDSDEAERRAQAREEKKERTRTGLQERISGLVRDRTSQLQVHTRSAFEALGKDNIPVKKQLLVANALPHTTPGGWITSMQAVQGLLDVDTVLRTKAVSTSAYAEITRPVLNAADSFSATHTQAFLMDLNTLESLTGSVPVSAEEQRCLADVQASLERINQLKKLKMKVSKANG
jgi:hypothetical protein